MPGNLRRGGVAPPLFCDERKRSVISGRPRVAGGLYASGNRSPMCRALLSLAAVIGAADFQSKSFRLPARRAPSERGVRPRWRHRRRRRLVSESEGFSSRPFDVRAFL